MFKIKSLAIMLVLVFITSIVIPSTNPMPVSAASYDIVSYGATANKPIIGK